MSLLLQINDCQLVKLQQNPEYMTRPKLVKIYDINYTRFSPAKKFRYLFKEPSQYPLDLNNVVGDPIEIKHSTQNNLLHPLLNTYFEDHNEKSLLEEDIDDDDNRNANKVEMTDVYSRRGILERIMGFYYEKNDFSALVSRCNGKLFVVELPQSEDAFERNQSGNNTHHRRFCQITSVGEYDVKMGRSRNMTHSRPTHKNRSNISAAAGKIFCQPWIKYIFWNILILYCGSF